MKIKNSRLNQIIIGFLATLAIMYVIKMMKKPEDYEDRTGPSPNEKITEEDLESVLKFIR